MFVKESGCTSPCTPKLAEDDLQDSDRIKASDDALCMKLKSSNSYIGFGVYFSGVVKPVSMSYVSFFMHAKT